MYYDVERKKIEESMQQIYRDFALKYVEIQNSELPESKKNTEITNQIKKSKKALEILRHSDSLDEISAEYKESLGIKKPNIPTNIDTNVIDTLVSMYAKRAKIPPRSFNGHSITDELTLRLGESLESIDTSAFEKELKQFFIKHYYDLLDDIFNDFLSDATEETGEIIKMANRHGLNPDKFDGFGYKLTVQNGLVAEEDTALGTNIFYGSPDGINRRIFDLYCEALYCDQTGSPIADDCRKLKKDYIVYAEKNGIQIKNSETSEVKSLEELNRKLSDLKIKEQKAIELYKQYTMAKVPKKL